MYNISRAAKHADVAQSVERILGKDEVTGSNPVISSRNQSEMAGFFVVWGWVRRNGRSILRFVDLHPSGAGVVSFSVSFFAL